MDDNDLTSAGPAPEVSQDLVILGDGEALDRELDQELRDAGLTPPQRFFLLKLAATGHITRSAQFAGIGAVTPWRWRRDNETFAAWYAKCHEMGMVTLEEEVKRRAFYGVREPVFYQGVMCGTVRKYSDTLAMFMLKAYDPKFRDQSTVTVQGGLAEALAAARSRTSGG